MIGAVIVIVLLDLLLLISGHRVRLRELFIQPGHRVQVVGYGEVYGMQTSIACTYWTGRSLRTQVYWYSPNNIMGRDECPFVTRQVEGK